MNFRKFGDIPNAAQSFDKDKITVTKAGKTYNQYEFIQTANVDTDIYEVMKKYNLQQDEAVEYMNSKGGIKGIYADLTKFQEECINKGDLTKYQEKANEMFELLPADIKSKYENNLEQFLLDMTKQQQKQQKGENNAEPEQNQQ